MSFKCLVINENTTSSNMVGTKKSQELVNRGTKKSILETKELKVHFRQNKRSKMYLSFFIYN